MTEKNRLGFELQKKSSAPFRDTSVSDFAIAVGSLLNWEDMALRNVSSYAMPMQILKTLRIVVMQISISVSLST